MFSCCKCVNKKSNKKLKTSDEKNADLPENYEKVDDDATKSDDLLIKLSTDKDIDGNVKEIINDDKNDNKIAELPSIELSSKNYSDNLVKDVEQKDSDNGGVNNIIILSAENVQSQQETTSTINVSGKNITKNIECEVVISPPSPQQEYDEVSGDNSNIKAEETIMLASDSADAHLSEFDVTNDADEDDDRSPPDNIDQTLSDTSNDSTTISENSQNVPIHECSSPPLPKPSSPTTGSSSIVAASATIDAEQTTNIDPDNDSTSSPSADVTPNDQPKSCLSRRCSSRTSIKKKVNYSEDQEIIPLPIDSPPFSSNGTGDDDEVFSDSISPKIPRGDMCTPYPKKKGSIPGMVLPDWFTDDREVGGILEPPVTPIGRDELALKRHRFFTDLLTAAQAAAEHRVRFDPLGPNISIESNKSSINDCDPDLKPSASAELEGLINRLERIVERLERAVSAQGLDKVNATFNAIIQKTDSEEIDSFPLPLLPTNQPASGPSSFVLSEEQPLPSPPPPVDDTQFIHQTNNEDDRGYLNANGSVDLDSLPTVLSLICTSAEEYFAEDVVSTTAAATDSEPITSMSVNGYEDIIAGPLAQYLSLSKTIGGDVAKHSEMVQKSFTAQLQYVKLAAASAQPTSAKQQELLKPTSENISAIQDYREKNRSSSFFNHLSAISESIPALGWVCVSPTPGPHVKEMNDAGQFYTNRVLKDWKEKDKNHVEWARSWVQTLTELQQYIKQYHTTGLVWSGKGDASASTGGLPPPPPLMPPPPPVLPPLGDLSLNQQGDDRSALFAQINQGEDITKSLKRVTADMQTHKNTALRTGPAPFKAPAQSTVSVKPSAPVGPIQKEPVFMRDGKKWIIEYQRSNPNLLVEDAEMNNVVYVFRCEGSTLTVKGKINSIIMDSCKKCSILFDSVVSSVEFVNCQSVQMQVLGNVPTISIDKTDGCQMYLCEKSKDVEIISSKSSEMNVLIPKGNGDYTEKPIPEQFKTTITGNALNTICVESLG